jgi:hypothetical protein
LAQQPPHALVCDPGIELAGGFDVLWLDRLWRARLDGVVDPLKRRSVLGDDHAARFSFRISISILRLFRSTNLCRRIVFRRDLGLQRFDSASVSKYCCSIVFMMPPTK